MRRREGDVRRAARQTSVCFTLQRRGAGHNEGMTIIHQFAAHVSKSRRALEKFPGNIGLALLTVLASSRNSRSSMDPLLSVSYCRNKTETKTLTADVEVNANIGHNTLFRSRSMRHSPLFLHCSNTDGHVLRCRFLPACVVAHGRFLRASEQPLWVATT